MGRIYLIYWDPEHIGRKDKKDILFYVCCVYSWESPHLGDSNEYTQHTIMLYM